MKTAPGALIGDTEESCRGFRGGKIWLVWVPVHRLQMHLEAKVGPWYSSGAAHLVF